jgi:hypothetical protein
MYVVGAACITAERRLLLLLLLILLLILLLLPMLMLAVGTIDGVCREVSRATTIHALRAAFCRDWRRVLGYVANS